MHVRKIAAAASLACGAALALAPLAQADLTSTVSSTLDAEIASQNSLFETYAALSGDAADITKGGTGIYDSFTTPADLAKDAPHLVPGVADYGDVTQLETYLYGANPIIAGISTASGPFSEFNGALTEFDDAYNVLAYAAANGGNLDTNVGDYLGSATNIGNAVSGEGATVSSAYQYFLNFGLGDLKGYDAAFAPAQTATAPSDIYQLEANEIVQLNNLFELDGKLAGVYGEIIPNTSATTNVGFDTISADNLNATFNDLVTGLNPANASGDPGSYDVLNGALTEFYNAFNVGDYSLLNSGALLPAADIFGTHAEMTTVAASISEYLTLGYQDLLGFFEPAALIP
jgi:hypothetical protein